MLSRYRILGKLGSGGMGVVYRAEDLTLKRPVALKFLRGTSLPQEQTRARFLREAQTAAALNHPNICTIHEVGEVQKGEEEALGSKERLEVGTPFIAMELVEGNTLEAMLLRNGSLPFDDLLGIALQVADGMAAAHARRIIHRDLKPGNVMVTKERRVKILDFGLAKPLEPARPDDAVGTEAETASAELTREGRVVGTVAYMSPEQAKGERVDSRSDVFSFGIMLYELTTGTRPFQGSTTLWTLAKIMEAEPEPIPESRADIPLELRRIVLRCLQRKPEDRYNDTRDLVAALKALRKEATSAAPKTVSGDADPTLARSDFRPRLLWAAAVAGVLVVAISAVVLVGVRGGRPSRVLPPTARQITFTGSVRAPAISPDGQFIAYVETASSGGEQLTVQDLAGGTPLVILSAAGIGTPRWTPDGSEILAGVTGEDDVRRGYLVPRLGGTPRRLPAFDFWAWSPDGSKLAGANMTERKGITIADRSTGDQRSMPIDASFNWFLGLDWSSTGALFAVVTLSDANNLSTIWTLPASGGPPQRIVEKDVLYCPRFSPHGDELYYLSGRSGSATTSLWKAPIDPRSGHLSGVPTLVLSTLEIPSFPPHAALFTLSRDGKWLMYARNTTRSNVWLAEMDATAEGGVRTTQLTSGTSLDVSPRFSPDGRSIAFVRRNNLFVLGVDGSAPEQLTFGDADHFAPAWSPDGSEIAFVSQERGTSTVSRITATGGDARPFTRTVGSGDRAGDLAWFPGKRILYQKSGNRNFALLDPATEAERPLLKDESLGLLWRPRFSPDATRVAVLRKRTDGPGEGVSIISLESAAEQRVLDGFAWPLGWSPDGANVYIIASAKVGPALTLTSPQILKVPDHGGPAVEVLNLPFKEVNVADGGNDVSPDGRRFVLSVSDTRSDAWLVENFDPDRHGE